jgi:hypothetical protein
MIIIADSSVGERGSLALALSEDRTMTSPAVRTNDISTVCFSPNNRDIKQPLSILIKIIMLAAQSTTDQRYDWEIEIR